MDVLRRLPSALQYRVLWYTLRCPHDMRRRTGFMWYCRLCGEPCYNQCMHLTSAHPEDDGSAAFSPRSAPGGWVCPACLRSRCQDQRTGMHVACARCIMNGLCVCGS